jgi:hypothetical protein
MCLSNIPGKHKIEEQQKTATLGTAHIVGSTDVKAQNTEHWKQHYMYRIL